jgi:GNAT superfamily N-acetyltransferase
MSNARFVRPDDVAWDTALANCKHDLYHLSAYAKLEGSWISAEPIAFLYERHGHTMLLPLLERLTPAGMGTDAVTPYGYSPPVFSSGAPMSFIVDAFRAFQDAAKARGLISTFIRLHPMLCSELTAPYHGSDIRWSQIARGCTVTMPMDDEPELWLRGVASGHRLDLRKLKGDGCRFVMDTDAAWSEFPEIYRATMQRIGARPAYFYSDEYLAAFRERLNGYVHCAAVEDADGEILCTSLFTLVDGLLQYHLSGTRQEFVRRAPTKMLLAEVREWARERGIRLFHLGGGYGSGRDTLFAFKQRFGGEALTFRTVSIVHDADKFQAECEAWQARSGAPLADPEGFFPPYRVPIVTDQRSA